MVRTSRFEPRVLSFLARRGTERHSINMLARQIGLTPKGMHKLLKRLEAQGIVKPERIGNAIFYRINFSSDLAKKVVELSLFEEIKLPYAKAQAKDLERLRPLAEAAVLFGSVLEKGEQAADIDVLFVVDEKRYKAFSKALDELSELKTKPIQPVVQTFTDLISNLKKRDKVVLEIIKTGKILWGHEIIVDAIKEAL